MRSHTRARTHTHTHTNNESWPDIVLWCCECVWNAYCLVSLQTILLRFTVCSVYLSAKLSNLLSVFLSSSLGTGRHSHSGSPFLDGRDDLAPKPLNVYGAVSASREERGTEMWVYDPRIVNMGTSCTIYFTVKSQLLIVIHSFSAVGHKWKKITSALLGLWHYLSEESSNIRM